MPTRRQLILTGLAGSTLLAGASWWALGRRSPTMKLAAFALSPKGRALFAAIAPVILGPAWQASANRMRIVDGVVLAIRQLSPSAQREIAQLIDLLTLAPARMTLAAIVPAWEDASSDDIAAFLQRWRDSRWGLLQSGYQALHDLVLGAWYADEQTWKTIGYAGPPALGKARS